MAADERTHDGVANAGRNWLTRRLPLSLNPVLARNDALTHLAEERPAQAVADAASQLARTNPGCQVEVEALSTLAAATRARAEASWRVVGNWLLIAIFGSLIVLAISFFVGDTSTFGADYSPYFSALIWLLVVPWAICQLLRFLMIAPWSRPKASVRPQPGEGSPSAAARSITP
jgi:hypothetical protein